MDCEKFDQILIDALYDELDELTLAAAKRHADGCQRCQGALSGLKATRKIGVLPLVPAPAGLDLRVLAAAREAQRNVPWPKRVSRAISWAGNYVMRPQLAMAALLVLAFGASLLLLRPKPDRSGPSRVSVTERGVPEQPAEDLHPDLRLGSSDRVPVAAGSRAARREDERNPAAAPPAFATPPAPLSTREATNAEPSLRGRSAGPADDLAPSPSLGLDKEKKGYEGVGSGAAANVPQSNGAGSASRDAYQAAQDLYDQGRYEESEKAFGAVAASGTSNAALASLNAAKSAQAAYGCGSAVSMYEQVFSRYPNTSPGYDAMLGAANCYKANGEIDKAERMYTTLMGIAGYRDRAEAALTELKVGQQQVASKAAVKPASKSAVPAGAAKKAAPAQTAIPKDAVKQ